MRRFLAILTAAALAGAAGCSLKPQPSAGQNALVETGEGTAGKGPEVSSKAPAPPVVPEPEPPKEPTPPPAVEEPKTPEPTPAPTPEPPKPEPIVTPPPTPEPPKEGPKPAKEPKKKPEPKEPKKGKEPKEAKVEGKKGVVVLSVKNEEGKKHLAFLGRLKEVEADFEVTKADGTTLSGKGGDAGPKGLTVKAESGEVTIPEKDVKEIKITVSGAVEETPTGIHVSQGKKSFQAPGENVVTIQYEGEEAKPFVAAKAAKGKGKGKKESKEEAAKKEGKEGKGKKEEGGKAGKQGKTGKEGKGAKEGKPEEEKTPEALGAVEG